MHINSLEDIVVKRYALAFLGAFGHVMVIEQYDLWHRLLDFFKKSDRVFFFLKLSSLEKEVKERFLLEVVNRFFDQKTSVKIALLINLLAVHGRTYLIQKIIEKILVLSRVRNGQMGFVVEISHNVEQEDIRALISALSVKINKKIFFDTVFNSSLIAGFRVTSDAYRLEKSIVKTVANMRKNIIC